MSNKQYDNVLIKRYGDWSVDNNSPDAEDVFNWLMKLPMNEYTIKKMNQ
jgi:hypothetical protein